jgi:hypothetical protein
MRVWRTNATYSQTCTPVGVLQGHDADVTCIAFPAPASLPILVSGDSLGRVIVWCVSFGAVILWGGGWEVGGGGGEGGKARKDVQRSVDDLHRAASMACCCHQ